MNLLDSVIGVFLITNFVKFYSLLLHAQEGLSRNKKVTEFCETLFEEGNRSPFLLACIVDMCSERAAENGSGDNNSKYTVARAKELCDDLANKYDIIRAKYWVSNLIWQVTKWIEFDQTFGNFKDIFN